MAERGGFEPPVEFDPYDGLANRSFRPLRHLSADIPSLYSIIHVFATGKMFFFGKNPAFFRFLTRFPFENDLTFLLNLLF